MRMNGKDHACQSFKIKIDTEREELTLPWGTQGKQRAASNSRYRGVICFGSAADGQTSLIRMQMLNRIAPQTHT
jgi:hypothetical protein